MPLALHTAQPCLDHLPLGGVNHHGHAAISGSEAMRVEKRAPSRPGCRRHGLVHIHINDLCAVFHLLACHCQCHCSYSPFKIMRAKALGARHVGALTDVDKQAARANLHRLRPDNFNRTAVICGVRFMRRTPYAAAR